MNENVRSFIDDIRDRELDSICQFLLDIVDVEVAPFFCDVCGQGAL